MAPDRSPTLEDLIAAIHSDPPHGMIASVHSAHVNQLRTQWGPWQPDNPLPSIYGLGIGRAIRRFTLLTWPETHRDTLTRYILDPSDEELTYVSQWDHKSTFRRRFGSWTYDAASDRSYRFDLWSNLHLGYVGKASGFPERLLRSGAGATHLITGKIPPGYLERLAERLLELELFPALDDPADQNAIDLGVTLWKRHGANLTQGQLLEAARMATGLATHAGRPSPDAP
ncbi:polymorphic toxin type 44 domain-containing protein [Chondromyces crocatus]|uniref:Bacterial toxin 44 domain-containing protein n=1 Tax=Chondromyces crocatus TaxID=52 RepID=A0A0K1EE24_CHOCO|nr:polymorphic toxin type 44 domain-containing protein [Chondromyces crocatus]AKT39115.1 uncharacterized protein CMC5_032620 [Chondromyces crocatus]